MVRDRATYIRLPAGSNACRDRLILVYYSAQLRCSYLTDGSMRMICRAVVCLVCSIPFGAIAQSSIGPGETARFIERILGDSFVYLRNASGSRVSETTGRVHITARG